MSLLIGAAASCVMVSKAFFWPAWLVSLGSLWRLAQPESAARRREKKLDEFKYGRASSSPTGF